MAPRRNLCVPSNRPLDHARRIPIANANVTRCLSKLSRESLITLVLDWLTPELLPICAPCLSEDEEENDEMEDVAYELAHSAEELQEIYEEMRRRKGGKREVIDRIVEGDWRRGITLYQLATAETRYLLEHPASLRWSAMAIKPIRNPSQTKSTTGQEHLLLPRLHMQSFLQILQRRLAPVSKVHYYSSRLDSRGAMLFRLGIWDSPYASSPALRSSRRTSSVGSSDHWRTIYIIFPDGAPFVYISQVVSHTKEMGLDGASTRTLITDGIAQALSAKESRFQLRATQLHVKSLDALFQFRGSEGSNSAAGGWSIFVDSDASVGSLDYSRGNSTERSSVLKKDALVHISGNGKRKSTADQETNFETDSSVTKRRKIIAAKRFGKAGLVQDVACIDQFSVRMTDPYPEVSSADQHPQANARKAGGSLKAQHTNESLSGWVPDIRITFNGSNVFAGLRALVESGVINGTKMPSWMTGEGNVSVGVVKDGKIALKKLDRAYET
jgi:central kinetochore subunit Mis15/CHL4